MIKINRLKQLREERGLNMKDAARALGLAYTTYVSYEKGDREPNSEVLIKLADFFDVSIDYLIGNSFRAQTTPKAATTEDNELTEYLEYLRTRPECRMLMRTVRGATKAEVEENVKFIETLRNYKKTDD